MARVESFLLGDCVHLGDWAFDRLCLVHGVGARVMTVKGEKWCVFLRKESLCGVKMLWTAPKHCPEPYLSSLCG